jgi:hypothetical protein
VATKEDLREPHPDEGDLVEGYVRYIFRLDPDEVIEIFKSISSKTYSAEMSAPLVSGTNRNFSLEDFCRFRNEVLYIANLIDLSKGSSYWALSSGYKILPNWKKPSVSCPPAYTIQTEKSESIVLSNYKIINTSGLPEIPSEYLEPLSAEELNELIAGEAQAKLNSTLPECVYWTYADSNLLPSQINIDSFTAAPNSCLPLKYMFELAGYPEISKSIQAAKAKTNGVRNLLNNISKRATAHLREVWKEYKDIEILLEPNGPLIDASIKDTYNRFALAKRSDGFKRFVSFLLHISSNVRTGQLSNTLILIDEPDVGLHPSGARYLKDELVEISKSNYVVYSTHSIFMIDREYVSRHIIVTKKDEITTTQDASGSSVFDEEVIFNALKFSMFEALKETNIVFEGWKDKHLFTTALKRLPTEYKHLKTVFKGVGLAQLYGVKDAGRVATILELAGRRYFIVSDNDKPAREAQKRFVESRGEGVWFCYGDLLDDVIEETGEDFVKNTVIIDCLNVVVTEYPYTADISKLELASGGKLKKIDAWLHSEGFSAEHKREVINKLRNV